MDSTMLKMAISGFMHDIGKVAIKEFLHIDQEYIDRHSNIFLPYRDGRYTHQHAVYTAAFIERFGDVLPAFFNRGGWGEGEPLIRLAAGHHRPETPMQWIVTEADRISSGWDRAQYEAYQFDIAPRNYMKTRLVPIFETLMREGSDSENEADAYVYALKPQSPQSIFPVPKSAAQPKASDALEEYRQLFDGFVRALGRLQHRFENIALWFEHFESLVMQFFSAIPAARAGRVIPDVSLYDHLKTTAALTAALYGFHRDTGTLSIPEIQNEEPEKLLLIAGDFFGIQNFIFNDSGSAGGHRAKLLRGRSFAVSLFSELAADMVCQTVGIPSVCVVFSAAGRFEIIAPNTESTRKAVAEVESRISDWLMSLTYGETGMGIATLAASPGDFAGGRYATLRSRMGEIMEERKYRKIDLNRYGGAVSGYLDAFRNDLPHPLCPFCGRRPSVAASRDVLSQGEVACGVCRDHIFLGTQLVRRNRMAIFNRETDAGQTNAMLLMPIFDTYQIAFVDGALEKLAAQNRLLHLFDLTLRGENDPPADIAVRQINGYIPVFQPEDLDATRYVAEGRSTHRQQEMTEAIQAGMPCTFSHIASMALNPKRDGGGLEGVDAIGVLKADVDNLGKLMSCGIRRDRITISRIATLSRQLNHFFTVFLPDLLRNRAEYRFIYTVFSGGDDLFLIGPWNRIIDLCEELHHRFAEYGCRNPQIHFSAGISIHKANIPISHLAQQAQDSLQTAKTGDKARLTLFGETVQLRELSELRRVRRQLETWLDDGWIHKAMLYRLNMLLEDAGMEKQLVRGQVIRLKDMGCVRWRAMLAYTIGRNVGRHLERENRRQAIETVHAALGGWLSQWGSALRIPLWELLYNQR